MNWVVFGNLYVALCGAALTAATYTLYGLPARVDAVVAVVFFATLVIYNLDRLVEPHPGDTAHERWVETHRGGLWRLTIIAAIGALTSVCWLEPAAQWSLAAAGCVAFGYCLPILGERRLPKDARRGRVRLKDLPGAKLPLIALVWTYATAGLPMLDAGVALDGTTAMVLASRLLFIAAVALPFDLPDMQRDRESGIATLPTVYGVGATRRIAFASAIGSAVFAVALPWPQAVAILISAACTGGLLALLRPDRGVLYFMVALDGMLLLQAALLRIATLCTWS